VAPGPAHGRLLLQAARLGRCQVGGGGHHRFCVSMQSSLVELNKLAQKSVKFLSFKCEFGQKRLDKTLGNLAQSSSSFSLTYFEPKIRLKRRARAWARSRLRGVRNLSPLLLSAKILATVFIIFADLKVGRFFIT